MKNCLRSLGQRLIELRFYYLPDDERLTSTLDFSQELTAQEKEFAKAFCVMCHAEIEAYLESLARKKAHAAFAKWDKFKKPSKCLMFLLYSYGFELNLEKRSSPKSRNDDGTRRTKFEILVETSPQVKKAYDDLIDNNHGIKERHLNSLFGTIGYDISKMDTVLLGDLNSWANDRGHHAHGFNRPLNPKDELDRVKRVFLALDKFTNQVDRL